jgi:hypothetical protein
VGVNSAASLISDTAERLHEILRIGGQVRLPPLGVACARKPGGIWHEVD